MWNRRIYYKRTGKFPYIWSVDNGHIRSQKVVKNFHIGPKCIVRGGHDFESGIENSPQVFISVRCKSMTIKDGEAYFE